MNLKIKIILLNYIQRLKFFSNLNISKILSLIYIKELKSAIYNIDEYVTILIYIKSELLNESFIIAKIIIKIYLIDNLKANIFIDNNVFIP